MYGNINSLHTDSYFRVYPKMVFIQIKHSPVLLYEINWWLSLPTAFDILLNLFRTIAKIKEDSSHQTHLFPWD